MRRPLRSHSGTLVTKTIRSGWETVGGDKRLLGHPFNFTPRRFRFAPRIKEKRCPLNAFLTPDRLLAFWMNTLVTYVRSGKPDLTNRQMAILLYVYARPGPHTVRGLAQALAVSKPVVTRALNRLGTLGYLRRERDENDKRNIFIMPTAKGAEFLAEFGHFLADDTFSGRTTHDAAA